MANPLDSLRREHAAVCLALRVLLAMADRVEAGLPFPAQDCAALLRFLREFVDGVHARKEADQILPALAVYGDDATAARAGGVLRTHEHGRALLHTLVLFWEPVGPLTDAERAVFVEAARAYAAHLHRAIELEECVLFPAVERWVPADDRLGWTGAFARVETERSSLDGWLPALEALARRWR